MRRDNWDQEDPQELLDTDHLEEEVQEVGQEELEQAEEDPELEFMSDLQEEQTILEEELLLL